MNLKEKITKVKEYCIQYMFPFQKKWTGHKLFLHVWHRPKVFYLLTYEEWLDRVIEIAEEKPINEREERFALMKPSTYQALDKAYQAWVKADQALDKADQAWVKADQALDKADQALDKAYQAWVKADQANLSKSHDKDCPNCKWHGSLFDGVLSQFD